MRKIVFFHESRIAPLIAIYLWWIYCPFFRILKSLNICFVVNIAGGVGHIICELDLFLRRLHCQEIDVRKRYIWIRKNDQFSAPCVKFYGKYFWFAKASYFLYELTLPLTIRFKEITYDAGLSGLQWQLDDKAKYIRPLKGQNYLNLLPLKSLIKLWEKYYQLRSQTSDEFPLITSLGSWNDLKELIGEQKQNRLLVHIKEEKRNATATPTDPTSYLTALQYLYAKKYQFVFVGREKMPLLFRDFNMINYAESRFASFENDIMLFQNATMAIVGGSGISFLADCYRIPYLYVNSWHFPAPPFSPLSLNVPTLLQTKEGRFLTFQEQIELYLEIEPDGQIPRLHSYIPRNATAEEIFQALLELEAMIEQPIPWTALQIQARELGKGSQLYDSQQRFSDSFLKKHMQAILSKPQ